MTGVMQRKETLVPALDDRCPGDMRASGGRGGETASREAGRQEQTVRCGGGEGPTGRVRLQGSPLTGHSTDHPAAPAPAVSSLVSCAAPCRWLCFTEQLQLTGLGHRAALHRRPPCLSPSREQGPDALRSESGVVLSIKDGGAGVAGEVRGDRGGLHRGLGKAGRQVQRTNKVHAPTFTVCSVMEAGAVGAGRSSPSHGTGKGFCSEPSRSPGRVSSWGI